MNRRHFVLAALGSALLAPPAIASGRAPRLELFKSPTCGCCTAWAAHMADAGFAVEARDVDQETLASLKARSGITPELGSCHTGFVDGYFVEGHVPATDVARLLSERPDALGLTVPGMPVGSPGMEIGSRRDPFETLLVRRGGAVEVFQRHA